MSSLIDFVGDVVSTVLVGDSHDVERLYLLTRDRRVIKLTLQFFAMDIYDGGAYISDCIVHARHEMSMGEWRRLVRGGHVILHGSFHALANRRKYIYRLLNTPRCIMALPSGFAHYAADTAITWVVDTYTGRAKYRRIPLDQVQSVAQPAFMDD